MHATSARNMQQKQLSGTAMATLLGQEKEQPRHRRRPKTSRTAGYRYEKLQHGEPVPNHIKDNVRFIRQKQRENQQKKALQEASANYQKPEFKMPKFRDVPSKLSGYMKQDRSPGSSRSSREYLKKGEGHRMSTPRKERDDTDNQENELSDSARKLSFSGEPKQDAGSETGDDKHSHGGDSTSYENREQSSSRRRPLTKPRVPRVDELNELPERTEKNFIHNNAVQARRYRQKTTQKNEENPIQREGYGQVPQYLQKRKEAWEKENAKRALYENDPECPPGMIPMSEEERVQTLATLKERREEVKKMLSKLPLVIETASAIRRKEDLEAKVKELDDAIQIFSRPKVYIEPDE